MKLAKIHIYKYFSKYWASVRFYIYKGKSPSTFFNYDTDFFEEIQEAEWEARAFCKWKKLKIRKIIREYKENTTW